MVRTIELDLKEAGGKIVGALFSVEVEWNTRRKQARENKLIIDFAQYQESYDKPKMTIWQEAGAGVLVEKFEKNPSELPRSCFAGAAWKCFRSYEAPILKQHTISSYIFFGSIP